MRKRPPFDPKKAVRLVEMRGVSSMECYRHPDGALRRILKDGSLTVKRGEAWGVNVLSLAKDAQGRAATGALHPAPDPCLPALTRQVSQRYCHRQLPPAAPAAFPALRRRVSFAYLIPLPL